MAQVIGKLAAAQVTKLAKQPGLHNDGGNLYLRVVRSKRGISAAWIYRYSGRDMGLGSLATVSLAQARRLAANAREQRQQGIDPLEARKAARAAASLEAAKSMSFEACVELFLASHEGGWKNHKHRQQWRNTLTPTRPPCWVSSL